MDQIVTHKRWMGQEYTRRLRDITNLELPVEEQWARSVYWMYGAVLCEEVDMDASELGRRLRDHGVETRPFFLGMHEQPAFHLRGLFLGERYPVAERLARRGLYLPSGSALTEDQLEHVCEAVGKVLV
jgi:perosamine synthetase